MLSSSVVPVLTVLLRCILLFVVGRKFIHCQLNDSYVYIRDAGFKNDKFVIFNFDFNPSMRIIGCTPNIIL